MSTRRRNVLFNVKDVGRGYGKDSWLRCREFVTRQILDFRKYHICSYMTQIKQKEVVNGPYFT